MMPSFAEVLQQVDFTLEEAALCIAKEVEFSDLDINHTLLVIQKASELVQQRLQPTDTVVDKLNRVSEILFEEIGIQGNIHDYYNPHNSFLNAVLLRHQGIPITLSILYMAIARRLDLSVYGVGLPGHFIIGCQTETGILYLDPFNGGLILTEEECEILALRFLPAGSYFSRDYLLPVSKHTILERLLNNLRQIYLQRNDLDHLLRVLHLQLILTPEDLETHRDLGILYGRIGKWGRAVRALRHYLYHRPQDEDAETLRFLLNQTLDHLSRLN